jgi:hypothetical protein
MEMLHSGYNSSVDVSQLDSISSSLQPLDFVILVVNPQEAPDISSVSYSQVVIAHKTTSVRNFIATGGQQTTQVSQQLAKTSHLLRCPISLIQSQLILKC